MNDSVSVVVCCLDFLPPCSFNPGIECILETNSLKPFHKCLVLFSLFGILFIFGLIFAYIRSFLQICFPIKFLGDSYDLMDFVEPESSLSLTLRHIKAVKVLVCRLGQVSLGKRDFDLKRLPG